MGPFFKGIHQMRQINWSKGWLWDVMFEAGPSGFDGWFPATDIKVNEGALESFPFNGGNGMYEIPKNTTVATIDITFADDIDLNVEKWLKEWIADILAGGSIKLLEQSVRKLGVAKLRNKGEVIDGYPKFYYVFPKGDLDFSGTSEEGTKSTQITFVVAGEA